MHKADVSWKSANLSQQTSVRAYSRQERTDRVQRRYMVVDKVMVGERETTRRVRLPGIDLHLVTWD